MGRACQESPSALTEVGDVVVTVNVNGSNHNNNLPLARKSLRVQPESGGTKYKTLIELVKSRTGSRSRLSE